MTTMVQAEQKKIRGFAQLAEQVLARSGPVRLVGLRGAAKALASAQLVRAGGDRPALFLTGTAKQTDAFVEDLRAALGQPPPEEGGRVRPFPHHDTPPYDRFSPQAFVIAQRMDVLYRWAALEPGAVVVAPWAALALRVPSRETVRRRTVRLEVGQSLDRDELVDTLITAGYARQPLVEERGELAVRGGIVDLFPPQRSHPVRVELMGDEVESIRDFDPASQRSQGKLARALAPPPREILFDRELVVERSPEIRTLAESHEIPARSVDELIDSLLRGHLPPGVEALAPLLQPALETVFDFLPRETLIVLDEPAEGRDRLSRFMEEGRENLHAARSAKRIVSPPEDLLISAEEIERTIAERHPVSLERIATAGGPERIESLRIETRGHEELATRLRNARSSGDALVPLMDQLWEWSQEGWRVMLSAPSLSGVERLRALLREYGLETRLAREPRPCWEWSAPGGVEVRVAALSEGFTLPLEGLAVVTEEEIFGPREKRRRAATWGKGAAIEALAQLAPGDHLVHEHHGIGIYRGLVMLELGTVTDEFLRIEYEGSDRLFLPVHRLNLIQRYAGAEGSPPRLDRLGGNTWSKAKRTVKKSMRDMARELVAVHAARETTPGYVFPPRDRSLEEFEAAFPFEETPDQVTAIEDVLADLSRPVPMDRLVCGDVGYGKTEVAARAAFQVAMEGKQVAVLAPTTILCQQHLETFERRFEGYPVQIESLSRFRSQKEAKRILEEMASGQVDIVIGTHRLLQKNVSYRDLGLLVVDEEHRFGVAHKERIKQLKKTVDVITLTATPIPRTLQMAFTGLRDLSVINTPPADRLSIRTQVCRFDESLIREVILREVRRGGQVFFVHNRVRSIGAIAALLERILPEAKVLVAHGQMRERDLEDRMLSFMRGEADVLLCTTIVESGLDIPRANSMLINRADALGLAQLYQLRGRVGRSGRRAYAYLMIPEKEALTRDATRRLEAIQDLSALGSGFRLANMDLEIRGAGNLLGREQSGNLGAVGYETYMQLLEEAVEELRGAVHEVHIDPEIRLRVPARLPDDYVSDVSQRLVLYKRLASAADDEEAAHVRDEILDRYGPLPPETENLLEVIRVKIAARRLGVVAVDVVKGEIVLTAAETSRVDPASLVDFITRTGSAIRVTPDHKIHAPLADHSPAGLFAAAHDLFARLADKGATQPTNPKG
jgi:transcription-repair coupling factor (superfamily II helicase)